MIESNDTALDRMNDLYFKRCTVSTDDLVKKEKRVSLETEMHPASLYQRDLPLKDENRFEKFLNSSDE